MKYILGIFIFIGLLSCTGESSDNTSEEEDLVDNFTITGTVKDGGNLTFYLEALSQQGKISVAQTRSDASGKFEMIGNIPGYGLYQLRMGESNDQIIPLTIVPDDKVELSASFSEFSTKPVVKGTEWSKVMTDYMKVYSVFHDKQMELMLLQDSLPADVLTERFINLKASVDSFSIAAMKRDPGNPFNIVLQGAATPSMGFNDWDPENLDVLKLVAASFEEKFPNSPVSTTLSNQVYQIELSYDEHQRNTSGTVPAPEIALNNPDGEEIKLSSLRGSYVLIDFWASWCGPCRKENPNVVRLYKKYKNKGFTVYSVSLDENKEAWQGAIESDGLIWPNHVSDLMRWQSPLPQLYGFSGIPHTVLINKEGNIIGVGLRGASLEQKLNEIFSK